MKRLLAAALLAIMTWAQADPALDVRLKKLEEELRCLVCQNQSLADSTAPLAEDLRREVRQLAVAGKSDDEIKQFLVARYGDFVLYRPPVKRTTWLLWFGPFVLLAAGGVIWWLILRENLVSYQVAAADLNAQVAALLATLATGGNVQKGANP